MVNPEQTQTDQRESQALYVYFLRVGIDGRLSTYNNEHTDSFPPWESR